MFSRTSVVSAFALALCLSVFSPRLSAQTLPQPPGGGSSDLDAFMEKVLARREVNRKVLNDYVLDEKETFEILGPGRARLHRTNREYTWFVKDGIHVRKVQLRWIKGVGAEGIRLAGPREGYHITRVMRDSDQ